MNFLKLFSIRSASSFSGPIFISILIILEIIFNADIADPASGISGYASVRIDITSKSACFPILSKTPKTPAIIPSLN